MTCKKKKKTEQIEESPTDLFNNLLNLLKVVNMVEWEGSELTSSHGHTKITIIYRETINESDLNTSRNNLLQLKKYRRNPKGISWWSSG